MLRRLWHSRAFPTPAPAPLPVAQHDAADAGQALSAARLLALVQTQSAQLALAEQQLAQAQHAQRQAVAALQEAQAELAQAQARAQAVANVLVLCAMFSTFPILRRLVLPFYLVPVLRER